MSNATITTITLVACGALAVAAYVGLILLPAWSAYTRTWERVAATFLSLYAFAAFLGLGLGGGLAVIWFWDSISP